MEIKKYIPNAITGLNLLAGSIAIVFIFNDKMHVSAILVCLAAVLDYLDGFTARLLNVYSNLGKELDSLADLVTFGLTPSLVLFQYITKAETGFNIDFYGINLLSLAGFSVVLFSAIRLAKFNVDTRQLFSFIGLPTPANGLFIISFPLILHFGTNDSLIYQAIAFIVSNAFITIGMALILSFLLISELPLFSLKFKNLSFRENRVRFYFLGGTLLLSIIFGFHAIPLIIVFYVILSIITRAQFNADFKNR